MEKRPFIPQPNGNHQENMNRALSHHMQINLSHLYISEETRLPQRAYLAVRHAIRHLQLSPGQTVLERTLADILGMSRTPVREALVRLELEGWVRLIPRRGFVVAPIVVDDLQQIYEVVEALDGIAGRLATGRVTPEELQQLELLIEKQENALANDDLLEWTDLDDQFHNGIVDLAKNPRLRGIMDNQSDQLYRARLFTIQHRPQPTRSIMEHKAILAVMKAGESEAARTMLQSHRFRARNEILEVLRNMPQT
ncbi:MULTISPECIES: GntR family transcriptional regulator [unclassified Paenibacillus]|uniref:GntR family transcriptional regulator n=1 Tax=unclassified Paenibacillus TaxID=185978 RepID=UPI001B5A8A42|nr:MULTISPECIES: GntR family transcriptional regulator [unclassified Paenibacillus]MBP1155828.1 DNA-binding GntR family transcriptional regulator [Paenibacillus sp. PvP091]MBP1168786.1 DNA-binding GntR family transcriptional regulator [Paenibacillus sp. PvR098]MBP2439814.1 DNA-binding GntR family transcriptional regulator [Paenibacillus sp. PvP052]